MSRGGGYSNIARCDVNLSFSIRLACFKPGIPFQIINTYPSVKGDYISGIVLIDYLFGNLINIKFNIFMNFHWCYIEIVYYVEAAKARTGCGYC